MTIPFTFVAVLIGRLPSIQQEVQQRKLLYMGLYLLIWGEAANLRFMPECLCYIYHHVCVKFFFFIVTHFFHAISAHEKKFMSHHVVTGKFTFKNVVSRFVITVPCIRKIVSKPPFTQFVNAAENCGIF